MKRIASIIGTALVFSCTLLLAQIERTTATLQGVVTTAGTGEALADVQVVLVTENGSKILSLTGVGGKFAIKDLLPGQYTIDLVRSGFVKPVRPYQPVNLSLASGENAIQLQLAATAVVSGRVLDSDGNPIGGALVMANPPEFINRPLYRPASSVPRPEYTIGHRFVWPCSPKRSPSPPSATTNELGEYRLFGLIPGEYYLVVSPTGQCNADYAYQFYPGVTDPSRAIPIRLQPGNNWSGTDIRLSRPSLHSIRFKIIQPDEIVRRVGFQGMEIQMTRKTGTGLDFLDSIQVMQLADGVYQTFPLPSGSYDLYYRPSIGDRRMGHLSVEIGNREGDVDGGAFVVREVRMTCKIRIAPSAAGSPATAFTIHLHPAGSDDNLYVPFTASTDGTCSTGGFNPLVPQDVMSQGEYEIGISGLPSDIYVASSQLDGQDIQNMRIVLDRETGKLELTLARGGTIEGTVRNRKGEPIGNSEVVLAPAPNLRQNWSLYKTAITDQHGAFLIRGVAPGEYRALARDDVEPGAYLNPTFMAPFDQQGIRVTIGQGTSVVVDIPQLLVP